MYSDIINYLRGVGHSTARKWYYKGVKSVDDVRNRMDELKVSKTVRVALKHFEDIKLVP